VIAFPPVPTLRTLVACVLLTFATIACGTLSVTPPAPTPADFPGIVTELGQRSIVVGRTVSGEAGCDDPTLIPTAIAFDAHGLDQADPVRIYVYIFRNRAAFERLRGTVDDCAQSFVTDPATYESIEQSPYVLAGQGPWAPEFKTAIMDALEAAAGTGN
jgi:hypothetical protein